MANFKGGFAFNNGAAKVEVEQAPDGTLISCVNPVTGESMGGNPNSVEVIEGTVGDIFPVGTLTVEEIEVLLSAMESNSASVILTIDASELGITDPITVPLMIYKSDESHTYLVGSSMSAGESIAEGLSIHYEAILTGLQLSILTQVSIAAGVGTITDLKPVIAGITVPTSTSIYRHPMPEAEEE